MMKQQNYLMHYLWLCFAISFLMYCDCKSGKKNNTNENKEKNLSLAVSPNSLLGSQQEITLTLTLDPTVSVVLAEDFKLKINILSERNNLNTTSTSSCIAYQSTTNKQWIEKKAVNERLSHFLIDDSITPTMCPITIPIEVRPGKDVVELTIGIELLDLQYDRSVGQANVQWKTTGRAVVIEGIADGQIIQDQKTYQFTIRNLKDRMHTGLLKFGFQSGTGAVNEPLFEIGQADATKMEVALNDLLGEQTTALKAEESTKPIHFFKKGNTQKASAQLYFTVLDEDGTLLAEKKLLWIDTNKHDTIVQDIQATFNTLKQQCLSHGESIFTIDNARHFYQTAIQSVGKYLNQLRTLGGDNLVASDKVLYQEIETFLVSQAKRLHQIMVDRAAFVTKTLPDALASMDNDLIQAAELTNQVHKIKNEVGNYNDTILGIQAVLPTVHEQEKVFENAFIIDAIDQADSTLAQAMIKKSTECLEKYTAIATQEATTILADSSHLTTQLPAHTPSTPSSIEELAASANKSFAATDLALDLLKKMILQGVDVQKASTQLIDSYLATAQVYQAVIQALKLRVASSETPLEAILTLAEQASKQVKIIRQLFTTADIVALQSAIFAQHECQACLDAEQVWLAAAQRWAVELDQQIAAYDQQAQVLLPESLDKLITKIASAIDPITQLISFAEQLGNAKNVLLQPKQKLHQVIIQARGDAVNHILKQIYQQTVPLDTALIYLNNAEKWVEDNQLSITLAANETTENIQRQLQVDLLAAYNYMANKQLEAIDADVITLVACEALANNIQRLFFMPGKTLFAQLANADVTQQQAVDILHALSDLYLTTSKAYMLCCQKAASAAATDLQKKAYAVLSEIYQGSQSTCASCNYLEAYRAAYVSINADLQAKYKEIKQCFEKVTIP